MSKIHFLPVKYGDSFIIECDKEDKHGTVVVDGGPTGCGDILRGKVEETGIPDLLVLTHYDDDHIGGLTQYIKACQLDNILPAKEVWANCAGYVEVENPVATRSILQGVKLSKLLNALAKTAGMKWRDDIEEGIGQEYPFADIEVVSPTGEVRGMVIEKQEEEGEKTRMKARKMEIDELTVPLEELAKDSPKAPNLNKSSELANAASIAFILRCDGLSVLMLGDCYPHNVEAYLRNVKGYSEDNPLEVDFVKVSHHGSKHNTSNELLDIIKCNHYIISTNGEKFSHPDRTSVAHILCHPKRDLNEKVHLYFNCGLEEIEQNGRPFIKEGEQEAWNFEIHDRTSVLSNPKPEEPAAPTSPEPDPAPEQGQEQVQENEPSEAEVIEKTIEPSPVTDKTEKQTSRKQIILWAAVAAALVLAVLLLFLSR